MSSTLPLEIALLTGEWEDILVRYDTNVYSLAKCVGQGDFKAVFNSPQLQALLKLGSNDLSLSFHDLLPGTSNSSSKDPNLQFIRLIAGITCLNAFIQVNWTGPDLDITPLQIFSIDGISEKELNQKATAELSRGGEPAYHLTQHASLLRVAQIIFEEVDLGLCQSAPWWRLRLTRIHQHVLDEPVPFPPSIAGDLSPLYSSFCSDRDLLGRLALEHGLLEHQVGQDKAASELFIKAARYFGLEYELTGALGKRTKFQQTDVTQLVLLAESRRRSSAEEKIQGSDARGDGAADDQEKIQENSKESKPTLPETLALNDDTLLEQTTFTSSSNAGSSGSNLEHLDPSSQPPLHPLDQCVLLSLCLNVRNTSPSNGLTVEQMKPYVDRVISHPRNWSVHTMALLLRSRLEADRTRTVERSTLQLQALIDQMPTSDASLPERLLYIHSLPMPSKWELEKELALRFLSLGVVRSALDIFERLEMWEEAVKCWQALERPEQGITIVRDLLEGRKQESDAVTIRGKALSESRRPKFDSAREAKLWCLLGDLEKQNALEHYTRAWDVSGQKSGRAMRSIGGYHFAYENYPKAIECLKRGAEINPLLSRPWFILGCACVRMERWEEARDAFVRCVSLDDEDGESWSNLATVYLRMGSGGLKAANSESEEATLSEDNDGSAQSASSIPFENKMLAFRALKIGLKYSYENWRMWINFMLVAMDVGEFSEGVRALGRVVEERATKVGAECVDEDVLDRLVGAVIRAPTAADVAEPGHSESTAPGVESSGTKLPNVGEGLRPRVMDLFERVLLPRVSSQRIYKAYARLLASQSRWSEALKYYMDAYKLSPSATIEKGQEVDKMQWLEAVNEVEEIVDLLRNFGPRSEEEQGSDGKADGEIDKKSQGRWRMQARSIVRTFMARTRDLFEDDPDWAKLADLIDDLKQ